MYADVWPLLRLPRHLHTYTYRVPEELIGKIQPGSFVRVPWRGASVDAIVTSTQESSPWTKASLISSKLLDHPVWDQAYIDVVAAYAREIASSPATLSYTLLPEAPKRIVRVDTEHSAATPGPRFSPQTHLRTADVAALREIVASDSKRDYVQTRRFADRLYLYRQLISKHSGCALILTPQLIDALELSQQLELAFPGQVLVWGLPEKQSDRWRRFLRICQADYRVIVGTRSAVCLPIPKLSAMIIDQDERPEHRSWEQAPYYDATELARRLAMARDIPLLITSAEPAIARLATETFTVLPDHAAPAETFIHNNRTQLLHDEVIDRISDALAAGAHALIVASKKSSAKLFCADCGHVWNCPACQSPLRVFAKSLDCPQCLYTRGMPAICDGCRGSRFIAPAPGLQALIEALPKMVRAPIVSFTSDHEATELVASQPSVIVSTPYTWRRLLREPKPPLGFVALFHPESILYQPDYRANERYRQLVQWHRAATYDYTRLPLVIQTSLPQGHLSHQQALVGLTAAERQQEIESRRQLRLPPFGHTAHLRLPADAAEALEQISAALRQTPEWTVLGPQQHRPTGEWRYVLSCTDEHRSSLDKLNDSVYSKAIIQIDPEQSSLL